MKKFKVEIYVIHKKGRCTWHDERVFFYRTTDEDGGRGWKPGWVFAHEHHAWTLPRELA